MTKVEKILLVALVLVVVLLLAACDKKPVAVAFPNPPADKLICADEPGRPGVVNMPVTDEQAARYMVELRRTGQTCRDDVNWLRDWFDMLPKGKR